MSEPLDLWRKLLEIAQDVWRYEIVKVDSSSITVGTLTVGIVLLGIGFFLAKRLSRRVANQLRQRWNVEASVSATFESLSFYLFLILFSLFAMHMANLPVTIFTVLGGALAIGVGFGSQNIVNNFISGVILMIERPLKVGDFVEIDGHTGYVKTIGMRSTILEVSGLSHLIIPNSKLLENNLRNWTLGSDERVRVQIDVGVSYDSDPLLVQKLLCELGAAHPRILKDPAPTAFLQRFGDSSLDFTLYVWIRFAHLPDRSTVASDIRFEILKKFREENISIPFPQREIRLLGHQNTPDLNRERGLIK